MSQSLPGRGHRNVHREDGGVGHQLCNTRDRHAEQIRDHSQDRERDHLRNSYVECRCILPDWWLTLLMNVLQLYHLHFGGADARHVNNPRDHHV